MAIIIDDENRIFTLQTQNTTYQMKQIHRMFCCIRIMGKKRITVTNLF